MSSVLISIIVPAYNIESHIGRCLDSILAQTHKRIEIIIVDDGSTDGTGIIIDQYASIDQRIIPIHKENGGVKWISQHVIFARYILKNRMRR